MSLENVDVQIQSVVTGPGADQVSSSMTEKLSAKNMDRITSVINSTVTSLQEKVDATAEESELKLDSVELSFGIDVEFETGLPIIGPIFGASAKSGATFQVTVTLKR